tara:strand:- start:140 stop:409 length:270 start_codon:yes stop_codon:yes gene_type:complete
VDAITLVGEALVIIVVGIGAAVEIAAPVLGYIFAIVVEFAGWVLEIGNVGTDELDSVTVTKRLVAATEYDPLGTTLDVKFTKRAVVGLE